MNKWEYNYFLTSDVLSDVIRGYKTGQADQDEHMPIRFVTKSWGFSETFWTEKEKKNIAETYLLHFLACSSFTNFNRKRLFIFIKFCTFLLTFPIYLLEKNKLSKTKNLLFSKWFVSCSDFWHKCDSIHEWERTCDVFNPDDMIP